MGIGCTQHRIRFKKLDSQTTGIHFSNVIVENDSVNPIDLDFLYNGGGVGIGDFNADGLEDLYFTSSLTECKLYLNRGSLSFEDVTRKAKAAGEGRWCNGVAVVDINNDGRDDIYLSATIKQNAADRKNVLYVNQGNSPAGDPVFKDMAEEYGLADTSFSVQAAFLDYDQDGDLDMYLLTTKLTRRDVVQFGSNNADLKKSNVDKLYRNDWSNSLHHPVFTDVSTTAGIVENGYGLGVTVADINQDGWQDVYVSNDFLDNDLLYINNKNGTFTNSLFSYFKHTSQNAMGNDVADINNDGLPDILTVDMDPADNFRKKKNMNSNNYFMYQNMAYGLFYKTYMLQYVRNTLQLNMGPRVKGMDSIGDPIFSDIGFFAGVAETDWSWNPSIADFNNDGRKDIFITNGYPRDVTDHDFTAFRKKSDGLVSKKKLINEIPQIKVANYAYQNLGDLKFKDVSLEWGIHLPSFSNGAVYADLDNDGDLDYVINNINEEASVFENRTRDLNKENSHYLKIKLAGQEKNIHAIGSAITLYYNNGEKQVMENSPYRGYLSTVSTSVLFGLGNTTAIDSLVVLWPDKRRSVLAHPPVDSAISIRYSESPSLPTPEKGSFGNGLFTDVTTSRNITYYHKEPDYIDFNDQRLLPHKLSQFGPALACGDLDNNGTDDIVIGGSPYNPPRLVMQSSQGTFSENLLKGISAEKLGKTENMGILLFDANNDGFNDLYFANGSSEFLPNSESFRDWLMINDGKGGFQYDSTAIPSWLGSKSCVKATDMDNDGDLDLFVGERIIPGSYPQPASGSIYRNDSKNGKAVFTDVTELVAPSLKNMGMICDAIWSDFNNDGWVDLIIAGEWMPLVFMQNTHGKLKKINAGPSVDHATGWWNSITAADVDNDGDVDYIAGNLGTNSFYRADTLHPVSIYAKDFDNNGKTDAIPFLFLPGTNGRLEEYPAHNRDDIMEQLPGLKKRFLTYREFAGARLQDIFTGKELKGALVLKSNTFQSCLIENMGNNRFTLRFLPPLAQLAPVYGIVAEDFDDDGDIDIALTGNDFGTDVGSGRYDAMNGLVLLGNGKGDFSPQSILASGLFLPGDGKALVQLTSARGKYLLAGSQNQSNLKLFEMRKDLQSVHFGRNDTYALLTLKNGMHRRVEKYYGSSFLSQSSPCILKGSSVKDIRFFHAEQKN